MTSVKTKFIKNGSYNTNFMYYKNEKELKQTLQPSPMQYGAKKVESEISLLFATLCTICKEQNLVIILPVRAVAVTAATTIAGRLMGGLPGMAVGFIAGAVIFFRSLRRRNKKPKSLPNLNRKTTLREIFNEMTIEEKSGLIQELLRCLKQPSVKLLVIEICKSQKIQIIAIKILSEFLHRRYGVNLEQAKKIPAFNI